MKIVIFGLTESSSGAQGHAPAWGGIAKALRRRGHHVTFIERALPYRTSIEEMAIPAAAPVVRYGGWDEIEPLARRELSDADVALVAPTTPDGALTCDLVRSSTVRVKVVYGSDVSFSSVNGFDFALTPAGLHEREPTHHGVPVLPILPAIDPDAHFPVAGDGRYRCDVSYLGSSSPAPESIERLFVQPAARLRRRTFLAANDVKLQGAWAWTDNVSFIPAVAPSERPKLLCSSRVTMNLAGQLNGVADYGQLLEAAACGVPVLSDWSPRLGQLFRPGREILIANATESAIAAIELSDRELARVAQAARERTLTEHTIDRRAADLEAAFESCASSAQRSADAAVWSGGDPLQMLRPFANQ